MEEIAKVTRQKKEREAREREAVSKRAKEPYNTLTRPQSTTTKRIPPPVNRKNKPPQTKQLTRVQQMIADAEERNRK